MTLKTIKRLVEKLATLPYILEVRAISKDLGGKWIDFQILHNYQTDWDYILPDEIKDEIFDLITDVNWELRDKTGEEWYFNYNLYYDKFPHLQPILDNCNILVISQSGMT